LPSLLFPLGQAAQQDAYFPVGSFDFKKIFDRRT